MYIYVLELGFSGASRAREASPAAAGPHFRYTRGGSPVHGDSSGGELRAGTATPCPCRPPPRGQLCLLVSGFCSRALAGCRVGIAVCGGCVCAERPSWRSALRLNYSLTPVYSFGSDGDESWCRGSGGAGARPCGCMFAVRVRALFLNVCAGKLGRGRGANR